MSLVFDIDDPALKAKIAALPEKMMEHAFEVLLKQAELIKALAQIYVPVETGALRDSIRIERGGEKMSWRRVSVRAGGYVTNPKTGKKVNYAAYQEFGTKHVSPQLYLSRAVYEVQPTIATMIETNVVQKVTT